jgi:hypothetical protein
LEFTLSQDIKKQTTIIGSFFQKEKGGGGFAGISTMRIGKT